MVKSISSIIVILSLFFLSRCVQCPACMPPPLEVGMRIADRSTGQDLVFTKRYSLDSLQVYYIENNHRQSLEIWSATDSVRQETVIVPTGWCQKSMAGIKHFYLQLNSSDVDSVVLDVVEIRKKCCSSEQLRQFEINGADMGIDLPDRLRIHWK